MKGTIIVVKFIFHFAYAEYAVIKIAQFLNEIFEEALCRCCVLMRSVGVKVIFFNFSIQNK